MCYSVQTDRNLVFTAVQIFKGFLANVKEDAPLKLLFEAARRASKTRLLMSEAGLGPKTF